MNQENNTGHGLSAVKAKIADTEKKVEQGISGIADESCTGSEGKGRDKSLLGSR